MNTSRKRLSLLGVLLTLATSTLQAQYYVDRLDNLFALPNTQTFSYPVVWNGAIYYVNAFPGAGGEIMSFDPVNGVQLALDVRLGGPGSGARDLAIVNNQLFFEADIADGAGDELFVWDFSSPTATRLSDIHPGTGNSDPVLITDLGGIAVFRANDGTTGQELWQYNGSISQVLDIRPGTPNSAPNFLTAWNGVLYFRANDGTNGNEMWAYDGVNPPVLFDIRVGGQSSNPRDFTAFNGKLYFGANGGGPLLANELYSYDGVNPPAVEQDIRPGAQSSTPQNLFVHNGILYFSATDGTNGQELWQYDGVNPATMVADINPGAGASTPRRFTSYNGELFFTADDGTTGEELWRYDGTNPPVLVVDFNPSGATTFNNLITLGDSLYVLANDGTGNVQYVVSDNPLPVEWASFGVSHGQGGVVLNWTTASEANNKGFWVQRSSDARTFEDIAWIGGSGTSNQPVSYRFLDETPWEGTAYYRILQEDFDGHTDPSEVRQLHQMSRELSMQLWPNPATDRVHVRLGSGQAGRWTLSDISGLELAHGMVEEELVLSLVDLKSGVYLVEVVSEQKRTLRRLTVQ